MFVRNNKPSNRNRESTNYFRSLKRDFLFTNIFHNHRHILQNPLPLPSPSSNLLHPPPLECKPKEQMQIEPTQSTQHTLEDINFVPDGDGDDSRVNDGLEGLEIPQYELQNKHPPHSNQNPNYQNSTIPYPLSNFFEGSPVKSEIVLLTPSEHESDLQEGYLSTLIEEYNNSENQTLPGMETPSLSLLNNANEHNVYPQNSTYSIFSRGEQIPRLRSDLVESIYIGEGDNRREEHYNPFSESYNPFEYN